MRPELEYYLGSQIRQSFRARRRIVEENDILVVLTHLQAPSVPCPKSLSELLSEKVKKLTSNVALTLLHHFSENLIPLRISNVFLPRIVLAVKPKRLIIHREVDVFRKAIDRLEYLRKRSPTLEKQPSLKRLIRKELLQHPTNPEILFDDSLGHIHALSCFGKKIRARACFHDGDFVHALFSASCFATS